MVSIIFIIAAVPALIFMVAKFLDTVWLRDVDKKVLRQRFEDWWLTVQYYNRLQLSLAITSRIRSWIDNVFGNHLFSRQAFRESFIPATGLLIVSLAIVGIINHQIFGIQPWSSYKESINMLSRTMQTGLNRDQEALKNASTTNAANLKIQIDYRVKAMRIINKYDTDFYRALYSIAFFIVLIIANSLLFFFSLVLCRLILREIVLTGRVFSTIALLILNTLLVGGVASVFLLVLTILANPWLWYESWAAWLLVGHSLKAILAATVIGAAGVWIFVGDALKVVLLITFLPSIFAFVMTFLSLAGIIFRDALHFVLSSFLLRCAEKSPLLVIGGCFGLLTGLIAGLAKLIDVVTRGGSP